METIQHDCVDQIKSTEAYFTFARRHFWGCLSSTLSPDANED